MESSQFNPPQRTSLNDVELAAAIGESHKDEAGILAAMQLLESQTQLRENDERAKVVWEDQMLRIGTPEALRALDNARRVDDGLEPIPYEAPKPVEPEPFEPEPVEPEPVEPEPVEAERVEAEPVEAETWALSKSNNNVSL